MSANRVVYKYPVYVSGGIELPAGAELLHVAMQGQYGPYLWALVDPDAKTAHREIYFVGTGHSMPLPDGGMERRHIGSCLTDGGEFVWHVFEDVPS